jgi:hypothetical protein
LDRFRGDAEERGASSSRYGESFLYGVNRYNLVDSAADWKRWHRDQFLAFGFFGCWLLAFLAIGYWLLAFGFWLLAFGFWLLALSHHRPACAHLSGGTRSLAVVRASPISSRN